MASRISGKSRWENKLTSGLPAFVNDVFSCLKKKDGSTGTLEVVNWRRTVEQAEPSLDLQLETDDSTV